jgi:hypothetical protein
MILVPVSDYEALDPFFIFYKIGVIGNNEVNAGHFARRKSQTAVDDDNILAVLNGSHIFSDLSDTTEKYNL